MVCDKCVCDKCCCCKCCKTKDDEPLMTITKKRGCTDILILLLYIFSWVVVIGILIDSIEKGADPNRIIRGMDMEGNLCGIDAAVKDKPLTAWPYPQEYKAKICVSDCSYTNSPQSTKMAWRHRSEKVLYYCLPVFVSDDSSVQIKVTGNVGTQFNSFTENANRIIGDLSTAWEIILVSAFVSLVITFIFLFFLQYMAGFLVFLCIALLLAAGVLLGKTLIDMSLDVDPDSTYFGEKEKILNVLGHMAYAFTAIYFLIVVGLYFQIKIACEVIKEAARAIGDMKSLMFFPIIPLLLALGYCAFWISCVLCYESIGEFSSQPTPLKVRKYGNGFDTSNIVSMISSINKIGEMNDNPANMTTFGRQYSSPDEFRIVASIYIFHLLWSFQFIYYFGMLVISGALADWYFTPRGPSGKKIWDTHGIGRHPVLNSLYRAVRYHLGTVATAALIIAIIQFLQAVIYYIERKTKDANGEPNAIQKAVFCVIKCVLKCLECCMDKINKNALVWTAIYGSSFLPAACHAFILIFKNLFRVAAINIVSVTLLTIGKITISLTVMGLFGYGFYAIDYLKQYVSDPILPSLLIFLLSFIVASVFLLIFEAVIDTIFFCFLVDCKNPKGKMLASRGLQKLVGKYSKKSKKKHALLEKTKKERIESETEETEESSDDDVDGL